MTTVSIPAADLRRSVSPDMFADLLPDETPQFAGSGGMLEVTFAATLDAATETAVRDRLLTTDAAQETARAGLRAKRDALTPGDPISDAVIAGIDYQLGE